MSLVFASTTEQLNAKVKLNNTTCLFLVDPEEWSSTLGILQRIFLKASEACLQKGMIDTETYMEFKPIGNHIEI